MTLRILILVATRRTRWMVIQVRTRQRANRTMRTVEKIRMMRRSLSPNLTLKCPGPKMESPDQHFLLHRTVACSLINLIVEETNRFAIQYIIKNGENIRPHSRVRQWKETNTNEIRTLIGLLILQGLGPKPEYKIKKRFHLLLKFLHFVDNSTINADTKNRKLAKVLPLLNHLREQFMTSYVPERDIAIDESLIGWKGRLGWKQYIPSKRKRFGIKLFALCETSGYMYNFIIYTGADTIYEAQHSQEPVTSRIVLSLVDSLLDKGYRLFLDNYYTSVDLVNKLVKRRTDCVGTIRANRKGIPKDLQVKLSKGRSVARYNRKIMIQKWHDKKNVLITTLHDKTMEKVLTKKGEIEKPTCVLEYNKKMGGVDLADNYLHYYGTARSRVKKYYMKMFWHFLSVTTLNSFHIYKRNGGRLKRINFLLELGEQIVRKYSSQITFGTRRSRTPMPSRFIERHFPSVKPPTTKQKPTKSVQYVLKRKSERKAVTGAKNAIRVCVPHRVLRFSIPSNKKAKKISKF
ncbi:unnamed protein product [Acanthoscelides obtectus]|uniref:PiggyBac transposable element-derived protein domain-containing protein n=1 Tax=Acanthoscelides obtectus TaxID=200917 RepID=A0A9P0KU19_ACAOB|nr:unnamed protein product [Acanthoscelides obtectus]CAK1674637.1 PiggyBac transposable element-derived protein 4 [Acanthoscelides obtectus]